MLSNKSESQGGEFFFLFLFLYLFILPEGTQLGKGLVKKTFKMDDLKF